MARREVRGPRRQVRRRVHVAGYPPARPEYARAVPVERPVCPTCGQPATEGLAGEDDTWECENEACPEFGQVVRIDPHSDD